MCKHHLDFLWCIGELSNGPRKDLLGLVELFELAIDVDEVEENARTFLHTELLAEIRAVLRTSHSFLLDLHGTGRVLHGWKSEDVLKGLFSLLPVFLLNFNLGFHEHEYWVIPNRKILCERLFEEVIGRAHIASI